MTKVFENIQKYYTLQTLWDLFLMTAFPLHLWALFLYFRDISWLSERTNLWDAIGVGAYGLLFAFVETLIMFCILVLLGFIAPPKWGASYRAQFMILLYLIVSLFSVLSQSFFVWSVKLPKFLINYMAISSHPLRVLYIVVLTIDIITVGLPVYFFIRTNKFSEFMRELIIKLSLLSIFYMMLDPIGLVIVFIRNYFAG